MRNVGNQGASFTMLDEKGAMGSHCKLRLVCHAFIQPVPRFHSKAVYLLATALTIEGSLLNGKQKEKEHGI